MKRLAAVLGLSAALILVTAPAGMARPVKSSAPTGYDVGYPQCGGAYPANAAFGIVGVNNGIVFSANPCLASEFAWAAAAANGRPAFYANTANPGAAYSSHWPVGQTAPQACTADAPDSPGCSYDYGWNAAKDSFADAAAAAGPSAASAAPWWLDVETGNSWETLESAYGETPQARENDTQALLGAVAALHDSAVAGVGVYSTAYQWGQITGGAAVVGSRFATSPSWVAGSTSAKSAQSLCGTTGFTGGPVALAQYPKSGYDADLAC